jgi:hypothetical protein
MPQGLKIESKTNILLYNSDYIAGVDYPINSQEKEEKEEKTLKKCIQKRLLD